MISAKRTARLDSLGRSKFNRTWPDKASISLNIGGGSSWNVLVIGKTAFQQSLQLGSASPKLDHVWNDARSLGSEACHS